MKDTALQYTEMVRRQYRIAWVMALLLAAGILLALHVGPVKLSILSLFINSDTSAWRVLVSIRMPRIMAAVLAGAGLSISGLSMQNVLRNPLASPFTLGISGAAAFGAAFSVMTSGMLGSLVAWDPGSYKFITPLLSGFSAFVCSMISVLIIITVMKHRGSRPSIIVLAGIMTSSLFSALTSALQYFANDRQLAEIIFWTFGDPGRATYPMLVVQALIILPILIWMVRHTWDFTLLQSGDDSAKAGGLEPARFRLRVLLLASLMTSMIVSGYGIISFVGLLAPHFCRYFFKSQTMLVTACAVFGGLFLLLSDTLARFVLQPVILPVGIVTAFFGAPFFIIMLIRNKGL